MKPLEVNLNDYQQLVEIYHAESDRAAAVLAGSFIEHYLAAFIKRFLVKDSDIDQLFHGFGPMASFSQRIYVAYAFRIIDRQARDDLIAIKDIRNHFAHNPKAATFADPALDKHFKKFGLPRSPVFTGPGKPSLTDRQLIYLFSISWLAGQFHNVIIDSKD
jgi:hypothetical protein